MVQYRILGFIKTGRKPVDQLPIHSDIMTTNISCKKILLLSTDTTTDKLSVSNKWNNRFNITLQYTTTQRCKKKTHMAQVNLLYLLTMQHIAEPCTNNICCCMAVWFVPNNVFIMVQLTEK